MDDKAILRLFWDRDERAIGETQKKYGGYCYSIARSILHSHEDAEECVADAYLAAWNAIPPHSPNPLSGFLGMLTRRISLDRHRRLSSKRRGGDTVTLSFDELEECIPNGESPYNSMDAQALARILNDFLKSLPKTQCNVFLRRYWYFDTVEQIAHRYGFGVSRVKMMLKRTRDKLKIELEKEGFQP